MTANSDRIERCFLWGATGQAKVLIEALSAGGPRVVALFDRDPALTGTTVAGVPVLGGAEAFDGWIAGALAEGPLGFLVAIGGTNGGDRLDLQERLAARGATPLRAVHRTAFVAADATVGAGAQILAQSAVCTEAVIGEATIVNTGAQVDHECRVGRGVHVMPGAVLAGCVVVQDFASIGSNATVLPRVVIGARAIVGAGAVVTRDVPPGATVIGVPAREVSS
jgi:sugar O-acyltransferase (sialic acid O-acetyltransferase NeuD family)